MRIFSGAGVGTVSIRIRSTLQGGLFKPQAEFLVGSRVSFERGVLLLPAFHPLLGRNSPEDALSSADIRKSRSWIKRGDAINNEQRKDHGYFQNRLRSGGACISSSETFACIAWSLRRPYGLEPRLTPRSVSAAEHSPGMPTLSYAHEKRRQYEEDNAKDPDTGSRGGKR